MSLANIWRGAVVLILDALALLLLAAILPGFELADPVSALGVAAVTGLLNALVWPFVARVALPLSVLTLGGFALVLNGVLVAVAVAITPGAEIHDWLTGVVVVVGLAALTALASALLAIDEDESWHRNVVRRQLRRRGDYERDRRARRGLPRDRRARARGRQARAARRQRADALALAARRQPPARALGDRLVVADRRLPGRSAARRQPRHAGLPLVGEGPRRGDRDQPPARRRGDRAPPLRRPRAAARRRRQPREHPLRRRRLTRCSR